jgi:hypothetical protein
MSSSSPKADNNNTTTSTHRLPKQKLTALARLKSFGGTFVNQHKPPPIVFPPLSWEINDDLLDIRHSPTPPLALAESNFDAPTPPEPVSFAKRLRILIENLPLPVALSSVKPAAPSAIDDGKRGSPIPLGMDDGLVRMLSSEDIMNGNHPTSSENQEEQERPGIWNVLASLRSGGKEDNPRPGAVEEEEGGLMLCMPLEPSNDSQLNLAECETVLEDVDESNTDRTSKPDQQTASTKKSDGPLNPAIEKHIWVPSTTQLSLLTTWWGYRLYLPPPVMAKLNGTSIKATARAAMITTALKWLLDKIPMMLVPPQLRPAVKMLKQLSPVVGYIGVFIAWSWDRVRVCDKGLCNLFYIYIKHEILNADYQETESS